ncbi:MAG: methyltransferase domain-containing protein [Gammaproteobacteria bacterium]
MKRDFLFAWYQTPRGKALQRVEAEFIRRSITVSCKQRVLQIGGLGWENQFIDCSLYENFIILDAHNLGYEEAVKIKAKSYSLPIQSESIDLILLPHLLEFDKYHFQTMREIERVLKAEGHLVIINFNPWSFWVRSQYFWKKRPSDSWQGHFISKQRVLDWLKLLNFETKSSSEFSIETYQGVSGGHFKIGYFSFFTTAYAIRAIKRRFTMIPLAGEAVKRPRLAILNGLESTQRLSNDD